MKKNVILLLLLFVFIFFSEVNVYADDCTYQFTETIIFEQDKYTMIKVTCTAVYSDGIWVITSESTQTKDVSFGYQLIESDYYPGGQDTVVSTARKYFNITDSNNTIVCRFYIYCSVDIYSDLTDHGYVMVN